jgi:hypothetical protein
MVRRIGTLLAAAALLAVVMTAPRAQAQPSPDAPPPQPPPPAYAVPAGPAEIEDWEEGEPIPPGYVPESRVRKGLVIAGAITLGVKWLIDIPVALILVAAEEVVEGESTRYWPLFIPAVGPFITMGTATNEATAAYVLLAIDGVIQTGGLAMLIVGLAAQETVLVRQSKGFDLKVAPVVGHDFQGIGLTGTF